MWPEHPEAIVVPVPRHLPGPAHSLLTTVSREIATVRGWHEAEDALRRIGRAPEAKVGGTRDPEVEAATLEWRVPSHDGVIVLIDDVVRTGATLRACAVAIRAAGDRRSVVAIAVAAAIGPDATDDGDDRTVAGS
jgi:predicted amidophosphoribosyltransferase